MRYQKILDTLELIRKKTKKPLNAPEPCYKKEGVFTGTNAAPKSLNIIRKRSETYMETESKLDTLSKEKDIESTEKEPIISNALMDEISYTLEDAQVKDQPDSDISIDEETPDTASELTDMKNEIQEIPDKQPEAAENPIPETDVSLDEEIAHLLEADDAMGSDLPDFDNIDFVQEVTVFDRERRSLMEAMMDSQAYKQEESAKEEITPQSEQVKESPLSKTPQNKSILAGIIILGVLLTLSAGFLYLNKSPSADASGRNQQVIPVKIPNNAINNASYVYFNDKDINLDTMGIKLQKMTYGPLSSIFYFTGYEDLKNFSISLTDDTGRKYARDMRIEKSADSVVFRPFKEDAASFNLEIFDIRNNQTKTLHFELKDNSMMPARYINTPIDISPDGNGSIMIDSATFANTGATLQLRFSNTNDKQYIISPETRITMLDGAYPVRSKSPAYGLYSKTPYKEDPGSRYLAYTAFQNNIITLARADFEPVRSLEGNVTLNVKGLSRLFSPEITIESADLFNFAAKGVKVIPFDDFNLVLEGMQHQGSVIALVMHGEDLKTNNRIEVKTEVELSAKDRAGKSVVIQGDCRSGPKGTDVLFKVGANPVINMDPGLIQIKLNSIRTILGDISVMLNLSELDTEPLASLQAARSEIEGVFANPSQADLIFIESDNLIGSVLELLNGEISDSILLHLINATRVDDQWVIQSDSLTRLAVS